MNVPLLGQEEHVIGIMFAESVTKIDLEAHTNTNTVCSTHTCEGWDENIA